MDLRRIGFFGKTSSIFLLWLRFASSALAVEPPQQATPPSPHVIPLEIATCAVIARGGIISLDWNPGFDYPSAVAGIDQFSLIFTSVGPDGSTSLHPGAPGMHLARLVSATPEPNGFYHFEFRLLAPPGNFRVVGAAIKPRLVPGSDGPTPQMTNSPARDRLCVTVESPPPGSAQP